MNQSKKINLFNLALNSVGLTVNKVYAELIYTTAIKIHKDELRIDDMTNLHNSIVDEKSVMMQDKIMVKVKNAGVENPEQFVQELAELFIGDVKI